MPGIDWAGRLIGALGGIAWGLATYFVVPILVIERTGPLTSVRRSAGVFRKRWGEQVTGELAMGFVFGLAMIPGFLVAGGGFIALEESNVATGVLALSIAAVLIVPVMAVSSALNELFTLELYRYASDGSADGLFEAPQLEATFKPRRRSWWQRMRNGDDDF